MLYQNPKQDTDSASVKSAEDAVRILLTDLQEAANLYQRNGREGAIAAQNYILMFLMRLEGTASIRQTFAGLLNALLSLEDGVTLPLLEPKKTKAGGRPSSPARQCDWAMAAATVTRLTEIGVSKPEACGKVAKACRDAGLRPERSVSKITARTVSYWVQRIDEDVSRDTLAGQTFDRILASKSETKSVNQLLNGLRISLSEFRSAEN